MSAPGTTPGPWANQDDGHDTSRKIHAAPHLGMALATVHSYWRGTGQRDAERNANAHLIAASPALYEALEAMLDIAEVWEQLDCRQNIQLENSGTVAAARAALAQARGEAA